MERKKKPASAFCRLVMAVVACSWGSIPSSAAESEQWPLALRSQISRLTDVGYRLGAVAAPACFLTAAGTGISIDYLEAYGAKDRPAVAAILGMTDAPQIAAVAQGSPAERAGIQPGDDIVAINGIPVGMLRSTSSDTSLFADELEYRLAATPKGSMVKLNLKRKGVAMKIELLPTIICATRFVVKTGLGVTAFSDGTNIAISSRLIEFADNDDELALIAAHELGHVIGRDGKADNLAERRRMEDRADLLGVRLSHCAGYNPEMGVQFWIRRDAGDWLRLFRDPTHRSRKSRVALMRKEIAMLACPFSASFVSASF
ncbi:PDZ domain-containing protein [Novosphingobium sp. P6W]|uniref:PDZ domain-containing protein n=1 Tax=Novosphingobium sp. P6W TaxID=1609758 RepID=UPI0013B43F50|nr:M48 family metallopeptidase [Novosphingobium sp. P6W]